jgi:transposase-like protein
MSILKLAKIINTQEKAAKAFQKERWHRGFGCLRCGSIKVWKHRRLKNGLQKYRCEDCKHVFSDQSTTILKWNKVRIEKLAVVNHLSKTNMGIREIAKESELNKETICSLKARLRNIRGEMYQSIMPKQLSGVIEMDETMIGKKWFWGAIERKQRNIIIERVPARTEEILTAKIWKYVEEESLLITDEWRGYNPDARFYNHWTVNHSKTFVDPHCRKIHTNTIEGLWAQLKRKIDRMCNGVKPENISDYINEYFYLKNCSQNKNPTFFPLYCDKR